jgi:hypothetical protein
MLQEIDQLLHGWFHNPARALSMQLKVCGAVVILSAPRGPLGLMPWNITGKTTVPGQHWLIQRFQV